MTGRFITEDPIRDGLNWYAYCGGNPVLYQDISGTEYTTDKDDKWLEKVWSVSCVGIIGSFKIKRLANTACKKATEKAAEWGLTNTYDNRADAYRHFIWNYMCIENNIKSIDVSRFMAHHEKIEQIYVGKNKEGNDCYLVPIASLMDTYNNYYGDIYAESGKYENYEEAFYAAEANNNTLNSLAETKVFYGIPDTWVYGADPNGKRYGNEYASVIIEDGMSLFPMSYKIVNPSDLVEPK